MILSVLLCLDWVIKKPNRQNTCWPSTFLQNNKYVQTGRFFMMQHSLCLGCISCFSLVTTSKTVLTLWLGLVTKTTWPGLAKHHGSAFSFGAHRICWKRLQVSIAKTRSCFVLCNKKCCKCQVGHLSQDLRHRCG